MVCFWLCGPNATDCLAHCFADFLVQHVPVVTGRFSLAVKRLGTLYQVNVITAPEASFVKRTCVKHLHCGNCLGCLRGLLLCLERLLKLSFLDFVNAVKIPLFIASRYCLGGGGN